MASYLHPGVYIEELPSGARPIEGVGTSTACFMGYATRGPVGSPVLISSWDDYVRNFGGLREVTASSRGDDLGLSVSAFFLNGGSKTYIIRLAAKDTPTTSRGTLSNAAAAKVLEVEAINPGAWADQLVLRLTPKPLPVGSVPAGNNFMAEVGRNEATPGGGSVFVPEENLGEVNGDDTATNGILRVINMSSRRIRVTLPAGITTSAAAATLSAAYVAVETLSGTLARGDDGDPPASGDYTPVLNALLKVRDINILLLPGVFKGDDGHTTAVEDMTAIVDAAVAHCEKIGNRMLIVDLAPGLSLSDETAINNLGLPTSTYAVTYYPWTRINNPFYNPDSNPAADRTVLVSPGATAAGLWAKTDGRRGVWKAPAGIEFPVLGVSSLEYVVEDPEQDFLNPAGVNALRRMPGFGPVVWGARTRSTRTNPEWRYVPVRRTALFIEESIYNGIQWAVFEPNDSRLWSSLRANIESFMNGLFRVGAFQGDKASDGYFVRCGLGQTMTQDDIDRGQVIVLVGFAPLKPAEFVIVRIQQKVAQQ
ncbi:MAG: phage tail sheath family protein [Zoogloea sp.]|nr:phage tail sheath family protein [Zoogloea sp.]